MSDIEILQQPQKETMRKFSDHVSSPKDCHTCAHFACGHSFLVAFENLSIEPVGVAFHLAYG